jgi:hypothetical protein
MVIGQHGAAMSLIGYMSAGGVVLELESILNAIFQHISAGFSFHYYNVPLTDREFYLTNNINHINISIPVLLNRVHDLVRRHLI